MTKRRNDDGDLFQRGRQLRARHGASPANLDAEAGRARAGDYLNAMVAAAAVIAHADGRLDLHERRRLVQSFLASPAFQGFSVAELAEELSDYMRAYAYDPHRAQELAIASLGATSLSPADRRAIVAICHQVIIADGLVHPVELGALHRIEIALGLANGAAAGDSPAGS